MYVNESRVQPIVITELVSPVCKTVWSSCGASLLAATAKQRGLKEIGRTSGSWILPIWRLPYGWEKSSFNLLKSFITTVQSGSAGHTPPSKMDRPRRPDDFCLFTRSLVLTGGYNTSPTPNCEHKGSTCPLLIVPKLAVARAPPTYWVNWMATRHSPCDIMMCQFQTMFFVFLVLVCLIIGLYAHWYKWVIRAAFNFQCSEMFRNSQTKRLIECSGGWLSSW